MHFFKMMLEENKDMEHAHDALSRKKKKRFPEEMKGIISFYINIHTKMWRVAKCEFGFAIVCGFHFLSCSCLYFPKCLQITHTSFFNKGKAHSVILIF